MSLADFSQEDGHANVPHFLAKLLRLTLHVWTADLLSAYTATNTVKYWCQTRKEQVVKHYNVLSFGGLCLWFYQDLGSVGPSRTPDPLVYFPSRPPYAIRGRRDPFPPLFKPWIRPCAKHQPRRSKAGCPRHAHLVSSHYHTYWACRSVSATCGCVAYGVYSNLLADHLHYIVLLLTASIWTVITMSRTQVSCRRRRWSRR